jgi:hypothetical protein
MQIGGGLLPREILKEFGCSWFGDNWCKTSAEILLRASTEVGKNGMELFGKEGTRFGTGIR